MRGIRVLALAGLTVATCLAGIAPAAHAATTTETINTLSVSTWFGGNEGPGGSVGNATLVEGPAPAPMGIGSAALEVDDNGRASLGTNEFAGQRLDALTTLDYWGYVAGATTNQLVLQFDADYDVTDANTVYQGRLTFVPSTPPPADAWRELNALTDGVWFASGAPGNTVCNQTTYCTWSQVLAAFPNAGIRNDSVQRGAFIFRLGGPITGGATAFVDKLTLATATDTRIVDFEPGGTITPTIGQAGTTITATSYGIKPKVNVNVYYSTNRGKSRIRICHSKANTAGIAQCIGKIPVVKKAGPAGAHAVTLSARAGGYKVTYVADFVLTP